MFIFGLGNPGEKYEKTRHNVGFIFLDKLQKEWSFPDFKFNKKFNAEISERKRSLPFFQKIIPSDQDNHSAILIKPQTFMNRSGESVEKIIHFYKQPANKIIVIHDDLDLPIGKYKISEGSSSAGHNGVQNIIDCLGTNDFFRIRIGIEIPDGRQSRRIPGQKFVLQNFSPQEFEFLNSVFKDIIAELENLKNGWR